MKWAASAMEVGAVGGTEPVMSMTIKLYSGGAVGKERPKEGSGWCGPRVRCGRHALGAMPPASCSKRWSFVISIFCSKWGNKVP
jgi:hypothetical protein